jgi:UDP-GlcNAc:undecaprenyl-phosphate/decaprenyl-phosphate GlcNAc-1-phosphate transferase
VIPNSNTVYIALFLASVIISGFVTWKVRNYAVAKDWVQGPVSKRHIHDVPTPRLGGVAIYVSFLAITGLLLAGEKIFGYSSALSAATFGLGYILIPGTLLFAVGLYDDVRGLPAIHKFAFQTVAAILLWLFGFRVFHIPVLVQGLDFGPWVSFAATIVWVLWITNAINLIDGLDGLAAGSALFSMLTVFTVSLISQNQQVVVTTLMLAGVILGFLKFNFNPATIFLGDCGSLFLGFMLSALALAGSRQAKAPTLIAVAIPIVSFGLPLLEVVLSVLRRLIGSQPLFAADRDHIHHRLLQMGYTHKQVVVLLYGVSALCALLSLFLLYPGRPVLGLVLLVLGTVFCFGVQKLGYPEFFEFGRIWHRVFEQKRVIAYNVALRKAGNNLCNVTTFADLGTGLRTVISDSDFDGFEFVMETPVVFPVAPGVKHKNGGGNEKPNGGNGHGVDGPPGTHPGGNGDISGNGNGNGHGSGPHAELKHHVRRAVWSRDGSPLNRRMLWSMTLYFFSKRAEPLAHLVLYRRLDRGDLLMDINVLVHQLQPLLEETAEVVAQNDKVICLGVNQVDDLLFTTGERNEVLSSRHLMH